MKELMKLIKKEFKQNPGNLNKTILSQESKEGSIAQVIKTNCSLQWNSENYQLKITR